MNPRWTKVRYKTASGQERVYDYSAPAQLERALKAGDTFLPVQRGKCSCWESDSLVVRNATAVQLMRRQIAYYDGEVLRALR